MPYTLAYFGLLVSSDAHFPLLEAAIAIAQDEYPELDVEDVLGEVDQLLARLKRRLPADSTALASLRILNQFFYHDLGFSGNINNYYDPDNSYPHAVLKTRRGIPISLAVLWLELAQGLGLNARGVAFPGHFMVKVNLPKGQVVIDPFTGQSLSREDLHERLIPFNQQNGLADLQPNCPAWVIMVILCRQKTIKKRLTQIFRWACTCSPPNRATSSPACCTPQRSAQNG